jgi:5-methylcytosine-specific restriction endonuclease McrA
MSYVFVLDTNKQALNPVYPGWGRKLLTAGMVAVFRRYLFTIILKPAVPHAPRARLRVKLDPGSTTTGLAVVNDHTEQVIWAAELAHRGRQIHEKLLARRAIRRSRRAWKTRYRQPRCDNRRRLDGWLPPSLHSRVQNILMWVNHQCRLCLVAAISQESVRFDTQPMEDPEISGVEYQQGELAGYEVPEYLLDKWEQTCADCGAREIPREVEHLDLRTRGGSNRVSNLTLACQVCNQAKGTLTAAEFGHPEIHGKAKRPLKDAAAVNATR